jgi:protein TIF31
MCIDFEGDKIALVREMVARATKHVLRRTVRGLPQAELAYAVSHFLNCLLGASLEPHPTPETGDLPSDQKRDWVDLTPDSLRQTIVDEVAQRYRYGLSKSYFDQGVGKVQLLRELCLRFGLQLELRSYQFEPASTQTNGNAHHSSDDDQKTDSAGQESVSGGSKKKANKKAKKAERHERTTTFEPEDILNIVPIVKGTPHRVCWTFFPAVTWFGLTEV